MKGVVISLSLLLFCSACSSLSGRHDTQRTPLIGNKAASVVTDDLAGVLAQLLDPLNTTLQFSEPSTAFGREVVREMRERSFGMQRVSDDQGARYLVYSESINTGSGRAKHYHYRIDLGDISAERSYELRGGRVIPIEPMIVRGSRQSAALDTALFTASSPTDDYIHQIDYREVDLGAISVPRVSLVTGQLVSEITSSALNLPNEVGTNAANTEVKNIYYTNESNFSGITRNYREVHRDIIFFGDDSLRLGRVGKKQIRQFLTRFDKDRDFINLIGCSQGVTRSKQGNEGLALGRAKRVYDEFVALGVPRTSLLDEGCWSPEASMARYPGRAVVVILKRRKS